MAPHGKELSEDLRIRIVALRKDGLGYKKFSNTLKLAVIHSEAGSQESPQFAEGNLSKSMNY